MWILILNSDFLPIPYGRQEITAEDEEAVLAALRSDFLTQGPIVNAFEEAFASYIGSKYAVAVSNGTTALHLSALAFNAGPGKKILTTPITFAASANCILYCGGEVEFVDIDENTFCIDPDLLERKLSEAPGTYAGIIPVDYAGHSADMEKIKKIAKKYGLWIIEDACHAPGATFIGEENRSYRCGDGSHADLTVFSFHPVKHIASGEGGMITTNDPILYEKLKILRSHGIVRDVALLKENHGGWYHEMQQLGFNYRLPDLNCALGLSQLKRADEGLKKRRVIAARYDKELKNPWIKIPETKNDQHAFHLYVVRSPFRKELYDYLKGHQIFPQVHYLPVYRHPYWKSLKVWPVCLKAEEFYSECLSLPMYPSLKDEQLSYVLEKLNGFTPKA